MAIRKEHMQLVMSLQDRKLYIESEKKKRSIAGELSHSDNWN
jgi:hypothetical protein